MTSSWLCNTIRNKVYDKLLWQSQIGETFSLTSGIIQHGRRFSSSRNCRRQNIARFTLLLLLICEYQFTKSKTIKQTHIHKTKDIKNNAWVTVNNDFCVTSEAICQRIITSDEVTSENHWQIASRVTQKSLFTVTNVLFYFLHAILCPEHTILVKTIIARSFRNCRQGRSFLT